MQGRVKLIDGRADALFVCHFAAGWQVGHNHPHPELTAEEVAAATAAAAAGAIAPAVPAWDPHAEVHGDGFKWTR